MTMYIFTFGLGCSVVLPFWHAFLSWRFSELNHRGRPTYWTVVTERIGWWLMIGIAAAYAVLFCVLVPVLTAL